MKIRLLSALVVAGLALIASAGGVGATESNYWPFWVERTDALTGLTTTSALGPLYFTQSTPDGLEISGFRPFWDDVRRM
jgi:hypothetical protein